jgi:hypothetical protein
VICTRLQLDQPSPNSRSVATKIDAGKSGNRRELPIENEKFRSAGQRIFLLSPAYAGGRRAQMILSKRAEFDLAKKLRSKRGATVAEVFTFLSGLYFRGKIAYANAFASTAECNCGVFVITPTRGLIDATSKITLKDLREFAAIDIDETDPRYRRPLERSVQRLEEVLPKDCDIVLLGSIATGKYVDIFLKHFKERLRFPADFVGRGDMSRGGLMLRCAADRQELTYISVAGAVLNGKRPPKLVPRRYSRSSRAKSRDPVEKSPK